MILTQGLKDILHKTNGRVINVSSKGYERCINNSKFYGVIKPKEFDFNEKAYSSMNQYGLSKIGNIFFTQYLNQYISERKLNIRTASLHPGKILTELFRDYKSFIINCAVFVFYPLLWLITKTKKIGAQTTLHLCYASNEEFVSGAYYSDC